MKKYSFIFLFLPFFFLNAQVSGNVEKGLFKINALAPGVTYEIGLGKKTTLNFDALVILGARGGSDRNTEFGVFPGLQADFRYFVNMDRRIAKGKNISRNSGNYIAFSNQLYSGNSFIGDLGLYSDFNHMAAITYGIQRTRPKGFYWGCSFGPGIYTDDFDSEFTLFIDLRLGWVLTKRK